MTDPIEPTIVAAISSLFGGRVYPDTSPEGVTYPFCIYQNVGGIPVNTLCGGGRFNSRIQFWIWAKPLPSGGGRVQANTLMGQVADILTADPINGIAQGGTVGAYDDVTRCYGAQQDFSFWFTS